MMTDPVEALKLANALAALLGSVSGSGFGTAVVSVVLAPWCVLVLLSVVQYRRFEAVVKMYEDNVDLVKKTLAMAEEYREQIVWCTQVVTQAKDSVENNMYCPLVRKTAKPRDVDV